jgi:hypothetical protein
MISTVNPLKKKRNLLYIKTLCVPRCKHLQPRLQKMNELLMFTAKVAVCSEVCTKYIKAIWALWRITEYWTWWYVKLPLGFKSLRALFWLFKCGRRQEKHVVENWSLRTIPALRWRYKNPKELITRSPEARLNTPNLLYQTKQVMLYGEIIAVYCEVKFNL